MSFNSMIADASSVSAARAAHVLARDTVNDPESSASARRKAEELLGMSFEELAVRIHKARLSKMPTRAAGQRPVPADSRASQVAMREKEAAERASLLERESILRDKAEAFSSGSDPFQTRLYGASGTQAPVPPATGPMVPIAGLRDTLRIFVSAAGEGPFKISSRPHIVLGEHRFSHRALAWTPEGDVSTVTLESDRPLVEDEVVTIVRALFGSDLEVLKVVEEHRAVTTGRQWPTAPLVRKGLG